jgi:DNA-binding CsgD family transcriptional regulator/tetratricopeptide (TPR) repeat protein
LFFLAFGEQRERASSVGGPERPAATAALDREYPNIRLALGWSLEFGEAQIGLRLARTVQFMWQARGYAGEGLAWLERLLALPVAEEPTSARAVCLLTAGRLATTLGRFEAAQTFFEPGLPLANSMDDPWVRWLGPQNFAIYKWMRGDLDTAYRYQQDALNITRASGDRIDEAISLACFAGIALDQGDRAAAQAFAEDARKAAQATGEEWAESLALARLGQLALQREDYPRAKIEFEQALDMCLGHGDTGFMAMALEGLGWVAVAEGQHEKARSHLVENLRLRDEMGDRPGSADALESLAAFAAALSKPQVALQLAGAAGAVRATIGAAESPWGRDLRDRWLPALQLALGEDVSAREWAAGQVMTTQQAIALVLTVHEPFAPVTGQEKEVVPQVPGLTSREVEVLRLVAKGQSNKEIAAELVLSVRTVERHITNLYGKIRARGKADATAYAIHHGLV